MQDSVLENDDQINICRSNVRRVEFNENPLIYAGLRMRDAVEPPCKRVVRTYFQSGWRCACQEIWQIAMSYPLINQMVIKCSSLYEQVSRGAQPSMLESLAAISETRDFDKAMVRCLAWHPREYFLAIVDEGDVVLQYDIKPVDVRPRFRDRDNAPLWPRLLFNKEQDHVACAAYRPVYTLELAVGCAEGVCLWNSIDDRDIRRLTQPLGCYKMLRSRSHRYITALQWNHNGQFLLTSSLGDCSIVVWEPDRFSKVHFVYIGASYTLLKWSPNEAWVFGARTDHWISLWQTKSSGWDRLISPMAGCIQTAAWSPCSNFLLYVLRDSTELMTVCFLEERSPWIGEPVVASYRVQKVADFNESLCTCRNPNQQTFGGIPHAMTLDPLGNYLAVIYKHQSYVGLYLSCFEAHSTVSILPLYTISSRQDEYPTCICFESLRNYQAATCPRSTLTIAWSSGRVQFKRLRQLQGSLNKLEQTALANPQSARETDSDSDRTSPSNWRKSNQNCE